MIRRVETTSLLTNPPYLHCKKPYSPHQPGLRAQSLRRPLTCIPAVRNMEGLGGCLRLLFLRLSLM